MSEINSTPAPANLRASRKQTAAAKKAAAPKPAPAKAPAAKAPAKKAGGTAAPKITWKLLGERDAKGDADAVGTANGREYKIAKQADGKSTATVKQGGKTTVLAEKVSGKSCWAACVKHNKAAA
jgi:hypothetical protein